MSGTSNIEVIGIYDGTQRIFFEPNFDVGVRISPERFSVKARRIFKRFLDAVECLRLALPAGGVGEPAIRQLSRPAHERQVPLHHVAAVFRFRNEAGDGREVVDAARRPRRGCDAARGIK